MRSNRDIGVREYTTRMGRLGAVGDINKPGSQQSRRSSTKLDAMINFVERWFVRPGDEPHQKHIFRIIPSFDWDIEANHVYALNTSSILPSTFSARIKAINTE